MNEHSNWSYVLFAALVAALYGFLGWAFDQWRKAKPPIWRIENQENPGNPVIFAQASNEWEAFRAASGELGARVGEEIESTFLSFGISPISIERLDDLAFQKLSYRLLADHHYVAQVCYSCGEALSDEKIDDLAPAYSFCDDQCAMNCPVSDAHAIEEPVIVTWFDI